MPRVNSDTAPRDAVSRMEGLIRIRRSMNPFAKPSPYPIPAWLALAAFPSDARAFTSIVRQRVRSSPGAHVKISELES
jgi:hypothetical protein